MAREVPFVLRRNRWRNLFDVVDLWAGDWRAFSVYIGEVEVGHRRSGVLVDSIERAILCSHREDSLSRAH